MNAGAGASDRPDAGFTLLEVVCALAIVALLAAIALPRLAPATSRSKLEALAVEVAALLKVDRAAALRRGTAVATEVNAGESRIRSGASGRLLRLPGDVRTTAVLPRACEGRPAHGEIRFLPSGLSCGGVVMLSATGTTYEVRVNWLTGGTEIVQRRS